MEDVVSYIAGRFPGRDSEIRALMPDNERLQELARRHYELHHRIEAVQWADNPQRIQQLESELQDIEHEIEDLL